MKLSEIFGRRRESSQRETFCLHLYARRLEITIFRSFAGQSQIHYERFLQRNSDSMSMMELFRLFNEISILMSLSGSLYAYTHTHLHAKTAL